MMELAGPIHLRMGGPMMTSHGMTVVFMKKGDYRLRRAELPQARWPKLALSEPDDAPLRAVSTGRGDGAFMEPRGCNRWQPAANRPEAETAKTSENRCHRLPPVACDVPW